MTSYDLCVAWNWEHDQDFVDLVQSYARQGHLAVLEVTPANLSTILRELNAGTMQIRAFLDRASDTDTSFLSLIEWVCRNPEVQFLNPYEMASRSWDKVTMHFALHQAGIQTPDTIILPSLSEHPDLPAIDFSQISEPYLMKPARGGGGSGVVLDIQSLDHLQDIRKEFMHDRYLLQSFIRPHLLDEQPAWFRILYCAPDVFPCWWDTETHHYKPVTDDELTNHTLHELYSIAKVLADISKLDLFSTEIALTPERDFIVIDYVNDQLDLRLQSKTLDGVPDVLVHQIAENLVAQVKNGNTG